MTFPTIQRDILLKEKADFSFSWRLKQDGDAVDTSAWEWEMNILDRVGGNTLFTLLNTGASPKITGGNEAANYVVTARLDSDLTEVNKPVLYYQLYGTRDNGIRDRFFEGKIPVGKDWEQVT